MENEIEFFELLEQKTAIMNHVEDGPIFGSGRDISIFDKCNMTLCWANIGQTYVSPFKYGSNKGNSLLGGDMKFFVNDYEVWKLEFVQEKEEEGMECMEQN